MIYKDRLILEGVKKPSESSDTILAEGLDDAIEYLHGCKFLGDPEGSVESIEREDVVNCIRNMRRKDIISIAGEVFPVDHKYKRARIVFADVADSGAVVMAHALSKLYNI